MIGFYLIAIAGALASCACAQELVCDPGVEFFPHPTDCGLYYACSEGHPILKECPPGLWWNNIINTCDYPLSSGCKPVSTTSGPSTTNSPSTNSSTTGSTTISSSTAGSSTTGSSTASTSDIPTEPTSSTVSTTPGTSSTGPSTTGSSTTVTSTTGSSTTVTSTIGSSTTGTSTTASSTTGSSTTSSSTTGSSTTVSSTSSIPTEPTIPTGSSTTSTTPSSSTTNLPSTEPPGGLPNSCPAVDDPQHIVRLPHESRCDYYYLCQRGNATLYACANSNHFNPRARICEVPAQAGCDRCPSVDVVGSEVRLPHENDCSLYYLCVDGSRTLYQCRTNWQFSRFVRECLVINEARCTV